jgi:ubiquinone/menaquinone biosynthesis C-methylase UbiE
VLPLIVDTKVPTGCKIRESGMPSEQIWRSFFDIEEVLNRMLINAQVVDAADFACGYGTFTIPAAQRIQGAMHAIDIDPEMIRIVNEKLQKLKLTNVKTIIRDLLTDASGLDDDSVDYVMLFNVLHLEDPVILLREALRVLRRGGRVGIVHWLRDPNTPRGPPLEMRPTVEQCLNWCLQAGFAAGSKSAFDLKPYHFGFLMRK